MDEPYALIIDDDGDMRDWCAEILTDAKIPSVQADNGAEALELLVKMNRKPNVILLDMLMDGVNGEEFLAARQTLPGDTWGDVPVVILSVVNPVKIRPKLSEDESVMIILQKPCRAEDLLRVIKHFFSV